jgi:hypothetical protein
MQMIRQRLNAVDQNASEPCEPNADSATDAAPGNPRHQHAFNQGSCVIRDERWLKAFDTRASTGLALMMLQQFPLTALQSLPWMATALSVSGFIIHLGLT